MHVRFALLVVTALLSAGCLGALEGELGQNAAEDHATTEGLTSVFERKNLPFVLDDEFSRTLEEGVYDILPVESVFVNVDLPIDEGGSALDGSAKVHMGLWLPDVPEGTPVPVIADVGPYYDDGDVPATEPANRLGRFLIENFVPHGYAVAQVSVFGSGESNHCMDLMGKSEQLGIDAAVTWLGTQDWSNGNVGLIGRSYDGSTPWQAATFGNPHLKTIAPISGLIGMHELMWRNGSAEFRGPIMHNVVYGQFGIDSAPGAFDLLSGDASVNPDSEDVYTLCKDYLAGPAQGVGAYLTGDHVAPEANDYWKERYFLDRALENYEGSVFFIHGLQDWNVDPHMAFPTYHKLQDAGFEVKGLFGQWAHDYPDRIEEHEQCDGNEDRCRPPQSVRLDWAQDLLEWFDHYLKGTGPQPPLHVEVQDNQGYWRIEESYPPRDAEAVELTFGDSTGTSDFMNAIGGAGFLGIGPETTATFEWGPLSETNATRLAGLPQLHVTVTPTGPGGQIFAYLEDADDGTRLGHAIMDLRYADGGNRMQPVTPGMPLVAKMEFEAFDAVLPAGHGLKLTLSQTGEDYMPPAVNDPVLVDTGDASVLRLFTVERAPDVFFAPPGVTYDEPVE